MSKWMIFRFQVNLGTSYSWYRACMRIEWFYNVKLICFAFDNALNFVFSASSADLALCGDYIMAQKLKLPIFVLKTILKLSFLVLFRLVVAKNMHIPAIWIVLEMKFSWTPRLNPVSEPYKALWIKQRTIITWSCLS